MGAWLESYNQLPADAQDRVARWIHLNKFISRTLRIDWENWVEDYLQPCMDAPLDYGFMEDCFPGLSGFDAIGGGITFTKEMDPATALVARVPLRAQNNLGKLSPKLQDLVAAMLERSEGEPTKLMPSDVAHFQKIFRQEKAVAMLKRKDFRKVVIARDGDDMTLTVEDGDELLRISVIEFGATMSKQLV